jgi:Icc-related predicted phosphoesterase
VKISRVLSLGTVLSCMLLAEEPILRVGIMTDTHIKTTRESCHLVQAALELFKEQKTDLVINVGDIADLHYPEGYKHYRDIFNETFPQDKPKEIYIYANHDTINQPDWDTAFAAVEELLQVPHNPRDQLEINGCFFLIFPQRIDVEDYENSIKEASAKYPGKPVFVIDHVPPYDTTRNSLVWGDRRRRQILDRYPQAVHISGHTHNSLRNEMCIWQGNFTCVNAACLQSWGGSLVGTAPTSKKSDEVLIMEVFNHKIDFHRFSVTDKKEFLADKLWSVPWPFDKDTAPYSVVARKAKAPKPQFPAGAKISVIPDSDGASVTLQFPYAHDPDSVEVYKIEISHQTADGAWVVFTRQDIQADFYLPPQQRPGQQPHAFNAGYFTAGKTYRFLVTPVDFFGNEGASLQAEAMIPNVEQGEVVYESSQPMQELQFLSGLSDGSPLPLVDGFYHHKSGNARLVLPDNVWAGPAKTRFRFTIDMEMKQPGPGQWTLVLRNPVPLTNANARIYTPPGESGIQRYVIDFRKRGEDYNYYFLIREGDAGFVQFKYVKIEKFP